MLAFPQIVTTANIIHITPLLVDYNVKIRSNGNTSLHYIHHSTI